MRLNETSSSCHRHHSELMHSDWRTSVVTGGKAIKLQYCTKDHHCSFGGTKCKM